MTHSVIVSEAILADGCGEIMEYSPPKPHRDCCGTSCLAMTGRKRARSDILSFAVQNLLPSVIIMAESGLHVVLC